MNDRTIGRRQVLHTLATGGIAAAVLVCADPPRATAAERHPHIRQAIKELREARMELKEGEKLFGGHREKALKAVEEAIEQLEKALEFAK